MWEAREQIYQGSAAHCENADTDCAQKDLPAQVRAATAAEGVMDIAIWQTLLSALGIVGLLYSLHLTREAVKTAAKGAEDAAHGLKIAEANAGHAARQVEISEDTAERQLRAYVIATAGQITSFNIGEQATCGIRLENKGQTPAYEVVQTRLALEFLEVTDNPPLGQSSPPRRAPVVLGPNCHVPVAVHTKERMTIAQREAVFGRKAVLHAFGTVEYIDAFKKRRTTKFSFMFGGAIGANNSGSMGMTADDNEAD
jgi:hypothetical protein